MGSRAEAELLSGLATREERIDAALGDAGGRVSLRDDGAAALAWVERYLQGLRERPVLAQVEPGAIRARLPASAPEEPEPFATVLRDLDEVLMPGVTHSQSPRYFAYFATTGSEPGILAELLIAGLNQVGILWRTSPAHFSRAFRAAYGLPPTEYRRAANAMHDRSTRSSWASVVL